MNSTLTFPAREPIFLSLILLYSAIGTMTAMVYRVRPNEIPISFPDSTFLKSAERLDRTSATGTVFIFQVEIVRISNCNDKSSVRKGTLIRHNKATDNKSNIANRLLISIKVHHVHIHVFPAEIHRLSIFYEGSAFAENSFQSRSCENCFTPSLQLLFFGSS